MSEVFLCATGQLSAQSRRDLHKAGIIVVEVDDPSTCQFIRATETVSAGDMLWAALGALRVDGIKQREQLAINLWEIVNAARQKRANGGAA